MHTRVQKSPVYIINSLSCMLSLEKYTHTEIVMQSVSLLLLGIQILLDILLSILVFVILRLWGYTHVHHTNYNPDTLNLKFYK